MVLAQPQRDHLTVDIRVVTDYSNNPTPRYHATPTEREPKTRSQSEQNCSEFTIAGPVLSTGLDAATGLGTATNSSTSVKGVLWYCPFTVQQCCTGRQRLAILRVTQHPNSCGPIRQEPHSRSRATTR